MKPNTFYRGVSSKLRQSGRGDYRVASEVPLCLTVHRIMPHFLEGRGKPVDTTAEKKSQLQHFKNTGQGWAKKRTQGFSPGQ